MSTRAPGGSVTMRTLPRGRARISWRASTCARSASSRCSPLGGGVSSRSAAERKCSRAPGALIGEAHANPRLQVKIAKERELTGRRDDLDGVAHRPGHLAHAVVPERLALLLAGARQGQAHRLAALLDGDEIGRDDPRCGQRQQIDHLAGGSPRFRGRRGRARAPSPAPR